MCMRGGRDNEGKMMIDDMGVEVREVDGRDRIGERE